MEEKKIFLLPIQIKEMNKGRIYYTDWAFEKLEQSNGALFSEE